MAIDESPNFKRINALLTTSGIVAPRLLAELGDQGYEVLINLLPDESHHAVSDERKIVEAQGIAYFHIPVDFGKPEMSDYENFTGILSRNLGKSIHIHCAANYRVTAFCALHAETAGLMTAAEADAFIQDIWPLENYPAWATFMADARQHLALARSSDD